MNSRKKLTLFILVILTLVLGGISVFITLKIQESQAPDPTDASTGAGYTNICGSSTASWGGRDTVRCRGCSPGSCSGTYVYKFYCNGRQTECGGSGATPYRQEGPGGSFSLGGEECGKTVQIDVFTQPNFNGLTDFFVYYTGDCVTPPPVESCPSTQARFRVTRNGVDLGLVAGGSFERSQVGSIDFMVLRDNNASTVFSGNVVLTGPNGYNVTYSGAGNSRAITPIQAGSYTLVASVGTTECARTTISITETVSTTCYRCTALTTDGNTCESQVVNTASCPTGWTTNSNCAAVETNGACPVVVTPITCYRCTEPTTDGNACESQTLTGNCPTGWTTNTNCAAETPAGACLIDAPTITCYRCTPATNDGNTCESQLVNGSLCPTGWNSNSNCSMNSGGACPVVIPETAIGDDAGFLLIGSALILLGYIVVKKNRRIEGWGNELTYYVHESIEDMLATSYEQKAEVNLKRKVDKIKRGK